MNSSRIPSAVLVLAVCVALAFALSQRPSLWASARAQDEPAPTKPKVVTAGQGGPSVQAIDEEYNRQLLELEKQRLEKLGQLAARQPQKDSQETYELLFRLAISNNLFREAEPIAQQVIKSGSALPVVSFLAQTVDIIASADRGNFDESLAELRRVIEPQPVQAQPAPSSPAVIDTRALLSICEAYYQRLVQGDRFDVARSAFQLVLKQSENPSVKGYCAARLNQLDMIGKPAPVIQGTDLSGKPVDSSAMKGDVVLVVFWASWCVPSSAEAGWLDKAYNDNQSRGFRILGINLDPLQKDGPKLETVMPNIKRFLVNHNIRWPNLVNGAGTQDYAAAYGVAEIPTNVLIGRDGNVIHIDLSRKNLEAVVARALAP
jgi:thiol-disulfide isomerase/thioredoxin